MEENLYNLETYNYSLPKELIAQYPCDKRDESKLLCYQKDKKEISHHVFYDLPDFLNDNDVLVLNNTKVLPARFFVKNDNGKKIEILLISSVSTDNLIWKVFMKGLPRARDLPWQVSAPLQVSAPWQVCTADASSSSLQIKIEIIDNETIKFKSHDDLKIVLDKIGKMPLPPYIKRDYGTMGQWDHAKDEDRYQTVFAKEPGAVAAPTASLHFTDEVIKKIKNKGVEILYLTLHVGPGTFLPVRTNDVRDHKLMPEKFSIEKEVWERILECKKNGKRIVACGTTVTRTLEYLSLRAYQPTNLGKEQIISGENDLYINPGYKYKIVDALITNFHLPKSSLLLLVSALIGWENLKNIYDEAIKEKYRFFSYGDATFIA